jgi:hypothetical protein
MTVDEIALRMTLFRLLPCALLALAFYRATYRCCDTRWAKLFNCCCVRMTSTPVRL